VTDPQDAPVDLTPLRDEMARRASRVVARVVDRVAAARASAARRFELVDDVRRRLARLALPAALAAAALFAAALATQDRPVPPEPLASIVMSAGPARRWVAQGDKPDAGAIAAAMRAVP
jgi:hypothetical protein